LQVADSESVFDTLKSVSLRERTLPLVLKIRRNFCTNVHGLRLFLHDTIVLSNVQAAILSTLMERLLKGWLQTSQFRSSGIGGQQVDVFAEVFRGIV
jgi:hypothetical protein